MAVGLFVLTLAMALVFMLYVLGNLCLEAKRPQRRPRPYDTGVIRFRKGSGRAAAAGADRRLNQAALSTGKVETVVLPMGVRRLAAKRATRS